MIPAGVKVFLASHPVDFRKGPDGLLALVREAGSDPFLCVVRDYVAAGSLTVEFQRFAVPGRYII
jgi:transposase